MINNYEIKRYEKLIPIIKIDEEYKNIIFSSIISSLNHKLSDGALKIYIDDFYRLNPSREFINPDPLLIINEYNNLISDIKLFIDYQLYKNMGRISNTRNIIFKEP